MATYALTRLQKRAFVALLLAFLVYEYLPLPLSLFSAGTSGLDPSAWTSTSYYNVAASEVPHLDAAIDAAAGVLLNAQHTTSASASPYEEVPSPSARVSQQAFTVERAHATCPRTAPLPSSVVELMKQSNRTVHLLNANIRHELEDARRELAVKTKELSQVQKQVTLLQKQVQSQQCSSQEQKQMDGDKQEQYRDADARLENRRRELESREKALKDTQAALEQQRSTQIEVEVQLGIRQQELAERSLALEEQSKMRIIEMATMEERHKVELAERHTRLTQCGASLGRVTASLEDRERQVTLLEKRLADLEKQLQEAKRLDKAHVADAAEKLKAAEQKLKKQEEASAMELASVQRQLGAEKQAHQRTAEQLALVQQREKRQSLEAAAELHRLQKQLADREEVVARHRQQVLELTEENTKLTCKLDSSEVAINTLEQHLMSLNQAMEATTQ